MLAGVLLHVIEAARPVDLAVDTGADRERPVDEMDQPAVVLVHDVHHGAAAEAAEIVRLAARGRVERGFAERHREAVGARLTGGDLGIELVQVGVGVVEALGHACPEGKVRGSVAPASAKPAARRRQLSQWPQGPPSADGS